VNRTGKTKNGLETFEPHLYPNKRYRIELEIEDVSELNALVRAGVLDGRVVTGVRMKGHLGSGPSVIPISDIKL
jgi:hypothetical protein